MTKHNQVGQGEVRSPNGTTNKRNTNFNFEDAWKAENKSVQQQQHQQVPPPVQQQKVPVNPPKPPAQNEPKADENKKRATFNNLFGLK